MPDPRITLPFVGPLAKAHRASVIGANMACHYALLSVDLPEHRGRSVERLVQYMTARLREEAGLSLPDALDAVIVAQAAVAAIARALPGSTPTLTLKVAEAMLDQVVREADVANYTDAVRHG